MDKRVGIVGIGIMGSAMARNLIAEGFEIFGYDPSPDAAERLRSLGGTPMTSAREVAEACRVAIFSLPSPDALANAAASFAAAAVEGRIAIECSTLPLDAKRMAEAMLAAAGTTLLDCPVSGTGAQAANKDLVIFGSGDEAAFAACAAVFDGMSRKRLYLGAFGNGSIMKYLANHLVTINNVASAEMMVLGMTAGLDPAVIYDALSDSAATSRIFQLRGPMMRDGRYLPATATIKTHLKDIAVIDAFARSHDCPVPLFETAAQVYFDGCDHGLADQDTAAVCTVLEGMAGYSRRPKAPAE
jgi:L-threonate 2-dehydrogenase